MSKVHINNDQGEFSKAVAENDKAIAEVDIKDPVENVDKLLKGKVLKEGKVIVETKPEDIGSDRADI